MCEFLSLKVYQLQVDELQVDEVVIRMKPTVSEAKTLSSCN